MAAPGKGPAVALVLDELSAAGCREINSGEVAIDAAF